jgi:hypothetical protein
MTRHVLYSLHYDADRARVGSILASSALIANTEAKPDEWAKLTRSGAFAVKRWIDNQLRGRSCTVVLIGAQTATRPWVHHEIKRSHELGLGLLGIYVHHLKDAQGRQSAKGANPFEHPASGLGELSSLVLTFDPPETDSKLAYRHIADNMARWAEQAVARAKAPP